MTALRILQLLMLSISPVATHMLLTVVDTELNGTGSLAPMALLDCVVRTIQFVAAVRRVVH